MLLRHYGIGTSYRLGFLPFVLFVKCIDPTGLSACDISEKVIGLDLEFTSIYTLLFLCSFILMCTYVTSEVRSFVSKVSFQYVMLQSSDRYKDTALLAP